MMLASMPVLNINPQGGIWWKALRHNISSPIAGENRRETKAFSMTTISDAAAAVTAALGVTKDLISVNKLLNEAEFKLKIADLSTSLAKAQIALADVQTDLSSKEKQISELKDAFAFKGETVQRNGFKYRAKDGKPVGNAFCPRCETVDGRFMAIFQTGKPGRVFECPQCHTDYGFGATYFRDPDDAASG